MPVDASKPQPAQAPDAVWDAADDERQARYSIYGSYVLAAWGGRTWEFAVALLLLHLYPQSLVLVSLYGILDNLARFTLGPVVGSYLDGAQRLHGARTVYLMQNGCIVSSAACACVLTFFPHWISLERTPAVFWVLVSMVCFLGSLSAAGSGGITVCERDWSNALCAGNSERLAKMNSGLRAIDQSCMMLGPSLAGCLFTFVGVQAALTLILVYNSIMWLPEYVLLRRAVHYSPQLRRLKQAHDSSSSGAQRPGWLHLVTRSWPLYVRQRVLPACVSLAAVYFTGLSLGFLMVAYLRSHGVSEAVISGARALGALCGMAGAAANAPLQRALGTRGSGLLGIWGQLTLLAVGSLPTLLARAGVAAVGAQAQVAALMGGVVCSRLFLWLFDLAVTQLMQETVLRDQLGAVVGCQGALQSAIEIGSFLLGVALRDPSQYHWVIVASLSAVAVAALNYSLFAACVDTTYDPIVDHDNDEVDINQ